MKILVTGAAGFIGFHAATALLARGHAVVGLDEVNAYYDPALKRARLAAIPAGDFRFIEADIAADAAFGAVGAVGAVDVVLHLAAQAGVRHALQDPGAY